ncbi:MAG: T9SS type A sorting domain-containing protein [Bacteroidales bacterium]|nr:T9SS type A sorting domain-containing protein [Candidatus Colimorpha pelethequi]
MLNLFFVGNSYGQNRCDLVIIPESATSCDLDRNPNSGIEVIRACRGNTICYTAVSNNAISYAWQVQGGEYTLEDNNRKCRITWGDGEEGLVVAVATFADGRTCTYETRVILDDKPDISSFSSPQYVVNPDNPDDKWLNVCVGDSITFIDNSTSTTTAIMDHYWSFNDLFFSSDPTFSFTPTEEGEFKLCHRVYNECGCYGEEFIKVIVGKSCPLEVSCYGTVCSGTTVKYKADRPSCRDYLWYVDPAEGTIQSGQHTQEVEVTWNAPASGYGTLYLDASTCDCTCKSRKSISIPIISNQVQITGSDVICLDEHQIFSLPLWGSTHYTWSVTPSTGLILIENNNILDVRALQTGTYTITVEADCDFLGCHTGPIQKVFHVKDKLHIQADAETICKGETVQFQTDQTASQSQWSITKDDVPYTGFSSLANADGITFTFNDAGIYKITAENNDYCNIPVVYLQVKDALPAPANISGPRIFCPYSSDQYAVEPSSPDYYIEWSWMDGTQQTFVGDAVNIDFGNAALDISARQVDRTTGCKSEPTTIHAVPFVLAAVPGSGVNICEGQPFTLSVIDQSASHVLYKWEVDPVSAISIQGDHLQPSINLLSNYTNYTGATVTLTRRYCGQERRDFVQVIFGEIDPPQIDVPSSVCQHTSVTFTILGDAAQYVAPTYSYWEVNDLMVGTATTEEFQYVFDQPGTYTVRLHYTSIFGCSAVSDPETVTVVSTPDLRIELLNGYLSVTPNGSLAGCSFLWSNGATSLSIPYTGGDASCVVTTPNGCTFELYYNQECQEVPNAITLEDQCYNYLSINVPLSIPSDYWVTITHNGHDFDYNPLGRTPTIEIPGTGDFTLTVRWKINGICYYSTLQGTVTNMLGFSVHDDCDGNLFVQDLTDYGDDPVPQRIVSVCDPLGVPISQQTLAANSSATSVQFTNDPDDVNYVPADGTEYLVQINYGSDLCTVSQEFPHGPVLTSTCVSIPSDVCEDTPVRIFSSCHGNGLYYTWDFGDESYNYGNNFDHVFGVRGNYTEDTYYGSVTVTDRNHCNVSSTFSVTAHRNPLEAGSIQQQNNVPQCPGIPVTLVYSSNATNRNESYHWFHDPSISTNYANVYAPGTYVLEVTDNHSCRYQTEANTSYPQTVTPFIVCDEHFCFGDDIHASTLPGIASSYAWRLFSGNTLVGSHTGTDWDISVSQPGDYRLELTITYGNNCTSSCSKSFTVHAKPATPHIGFDGSSCLSENGYVTLKSTDSPLLPLHWSNGAYGVSAPFLNDGYAAAQFIDPVSGCMSNPAHLTIPKVPDFDALLTGCYKICENRLPFNLPLYGLDVTATSIWKWIRNGYTIANGNFFSLPIWLPVSYPGDYFMKVYYNNQQCEDISPTLSIMTAPCDDPGITVPASLQVSIKGLSCEIKDCELVFHVALRVVNVSSSNIRIDGINCTSGATIINSTLPTSNISPYRDAVFSFDIIFGSDYPSTIMLYLYSGGSIVDTYTIDFSELLDCFQPSDCDFDITPILQLHTLNPNQCAFFDFSLPYVAGIGRILKVWCDNAVIIDGYNTGSSYDGLMMVDLGILTGLVLEQGKICFHILSCFEDKLCLSMVCVSAEQILHKFDLLREQSLPRQTLQRHDFDTEAAFSLAPNPANGVVHVIDSHGDACAMASVTLFSMQGKVMLAVESTDRFDASSLPSGSYIAKLRTAQGETHYLKFVKL